MAASDELAKLSMKLVVNVTVTTLQTTTQSALGNLAEANATTVLSNSTVTTTILPSVSTTVTKLLPTSPTTTTTTPMPVTSTDIVTTTVSKLTTKVPLPDESSSSGLVFLSIILFVVAVAVIAKIIYSNKKRRSDLIGGTARWRLAASQQSGAGPQQTAANYAPMGGVRQTNTTNGLDTPGPDRLDWERQFFDDTEATVPSRLQLDLSRT
nr:Protein D2024.5, isoform a [Haemonchus contortus]